MEERTRRAAELGIFVAIVALLLSFFRPDLLLSQTTVTGGDTGAHIYTPWVLKTQLLPRGLISWWSPDWYAGFPVLQFYFPFVITVQAVLAYLMPYEVALKSGTVLGTFFFPWPSTASSGSSGSAFSPPWWAPSCRWASCSWRASRSMAGTSRARWRASTPSP